MSHPFKSPYEDLPSKDCFMTSLTIGMEDHSYLLSLFPNRSVTQIVLTNLLHEFCKHLKSNGIKHGYNPDAVRNALTNLRLVGGVGGADADAYPKTVSGDDGPGVGGVERPPEGVPHAVSDDARKPQGGRGKAKKG